MALSPVRSDCPNPVHLFDMDHLTAWDCKHDAAMQASILQMRCSCVYAYGAQSNKHTVGHVLPSLNSVLSDQTRNYVFNRLCRRRKLAFVHDASWPRHSYL